MRVDRDTLCRVDWSLYGVRCLSDILSIGTTTWRAYIRRRRFGENRRKSKKVMENKEPPRLGEGTKKKENEKSELT